MSKIIASLSKMWLKNKMTKQDLATELKNMYENAQKVGLQSWQEKSLAKLNK